MSFRQAAVLSPVSFFLGVLFICFNVDHTILFKPVTETAIDDGFQFYTTFFNAPPAIKALLHALIAVGVTGLLAKMWKWDDSAMFFGGSSIAVYIFALAVYMGVTIPALRTIVEPIAGVDTRADQVEALSILCAGNTIMILCLLAVIVLQAGEEYARRLDTAAILAAAEEDAKAGVATPAEPSLETKKNK